MPQEEEKQNKVNYRRKSYLECYMLEILRSYYQIPQFVVPVFYNK